MKCQDAVSPVIGTLLVLALFTVSSATIVALVRPEIVEYQERGKVDTVAGQMANTMADVRHLAINGNTEEIRQPVFSLPGGILELEKGHTFATTIGYFGNVSSETAHINKAQGDYPSFYVGPLAATGDPALADVVDGSDQAVAVTFLHEGAPPPNLAYKVAAWDLVQWNELGSGPAPMAHGGPALPISWPTSTIADGPIRIELYDRSASPHALVADIYLYEQTSLTYRFDGESGPRTVYGENGGIIRGHDGRYKLVQTTLIKPPITEHGNELFSLRSVRLDTASGITASGSTQFGLIMRLEAAESFVHDHGASHLRMQFWGHHPHAWENQMTVQGFESDSDNGPGVTWAYEKDDGRHWSFPVHFSDSQIAVRESR